MTYQRCGRTRALVVAGTAALLFVGVDAQEVVVPDGGSTAAGDRAPMPTMADANTAFAVDLYKTLAQGSSDTNLFFSPYSVSTILGLVSSGARGDTAAQMHRTLHVAAPAVQDAGRAQVMRMLVEPRPQSYSLSIANSLWVSPTFPFRPEFIALAGRHYDAAVQAADFQGDPAGVRNRINRWVEEKTLNRITRIVPPDGIKPLTAMVLVNAVYFKDAWDSEFVPSRTMPDTFHVALGRTAPMRLMDKEDTWRYLENDEVQVVVLPYKWSPAEMLVVLPRRQDGLADLERRLTPALLAEWFAGLESSRGRVLLPKFKITSALPLVEPLRSLGMTEAFDPSTADFSGMATLTPGNRLWIDSVFHKAFVDVDEKGTEAAASTFLGMGGGPGRPVESFTFRADHPFLFAIRCAGSVLFLGRLSDPSRSE